MKTSKEQLVAPASKLIDTDDIDDVVAKLAPMLAVVGAGARFVGELEVFNPLLDLAADDALAFRGVIRLVMKKRAERGRNFSVLRPLLAGETEEEKQAWLEQAKDIAQEVNRNYVAETRARLRKMVNIENMNRPPSDRLIGKARQEYINKTWREWSDRRVALLAAEAERTGKRVPRSRMREIIDDMWAKIDLEIEQAEAAARKRMFRN